MKYLHLILPLVSTLLLVSCSPPARDSDSTPTPAATPPADAAPPITAAPSAVEAPPTAEARSTVRARPAAVAQVAPGAPLTPVAAPPVATPHPGVDAIESATKLYPDLGKLDSTFNATFRELYAERKKTAPASLSNPEWPLEIAREAAAMLGVAQQRPGDAPVAQTSSPTWFEQHTKNKPSALDAPAYNKTRAIYSRRIYYSDSSGRYWIDQNGIRHYY